ncbi:hypothetical protein NPIL_357001 [Nephila pilipes]|uniref:Uncharacterized protein n=1 Tax=Nephila pilipes TaxID=299642 RepID=A0A8X6PIK0_NEPPI|nr:hypothetical protein NPIL_357001 [Nephila pilipes]
MHIKKSQPPRAPVLQVKKQTKEKLPPIIEWVGEGESSSGAAANSSGINQLMSIDDKRLLQIIDFKTTLMTPLLQQPPPLPALLVNFSARIGYWTNISLPHPTQLFIDCHRCIYTILAQVCTK